MGRNIFLRRQIRFRLTEPLLLLLALDRKKLEFKRIIEEELELIWNKIYLGNIDKKILEFKMSLNIYLNHQILY